MKKCWILQVLKDEKKRTRKILGFQRMITSSVYWQTGEAQVRTPSKIYEEVQGIDTAIEETKLKTTEEREENK